MLSNDLLPVLTKRTNWNIVIPVEDAGLRLDQSLPRQCSGLSRTLARKIIDIGGVHISGRRVRSCSRTVKCGETISVYFDGLPLELYSISKADILYRDEDIIVLNKPAGVETQPTPARYQGTLYSALSLFLTDPFRPQLSPSIGMIQRLDRETSGVILFSISPKAHKPLTNAITSRLFHKKYLALVSGSVPPGEHTITSLLARSHRDNCVRSVVKGGDEATTHYRLISSTPELSLVEVTPVTGRMHQIRVHLAESGFPLLGDKRYGGPLQLGEISILRHMLHASSLNFQHPTRQEDIIISAPLPIDFQSLIDRCKLTTNKI